MIAVTFALPAESSDFIRRLRHRSPRKGTAQPISGLLRGRDVVVVHTGVGSSATQERVGNFLQTHSPSLLISSGFVGALSDELDPGDLLLALNYSTPVVLAAAKTALYGKPVRFGKMTTAPEMIDSLDQREELARKTKAIAVDMETEFIAQACVAANIPMISLRAVTDTPSHPFPAPARVLFNVKKQRTNLRGLAVYLATHPFRLRRFVAFGRRVSSARHDLAEAIELLLGSDTPD